ncbi:MAG: hypothetical protein AB4050_19590 [Synechococcus sp.]
MLRGRWHWKSVTTGTSYGYRNQLFTDYASGLFMGQGNDTHIDWVALPNGAPQGDKNCSVLIDGCDGVILAFHNYEGGKKDQSRLADLRIENSKNCAVLGGIKREAKTGIVYIKDSDNILITSFGAMRETPQDNLIYVIDSTNVLLGPANVQAQLESATGNLLEIIENDSNDLMIGYPQGFSIVKQGDFGIEALYPNPDAEFQAVFSISVGFCM